MLPFTNSLREKALAASWLKLVTQPSGTAYLDKGKEKVKYSDDAKQLSFLSSLFLFPIFLQMSVLTYSLTCIHTLGLAMILKIVCYRKRNNPKHILILNIYLEI